MIICFTGTGNSRCVADRLQEILGDEIVRFAPGVMRDPAKASLRVTDGRVIWVYPIYGWGVPYGVELGLRRTPLIFDSETVHHMVCTCGDDIGYADLDWRRMVEERGWTPGSVHSVQMPNTFTFMRGFDIDPPEVIAAKMAAMPERVDKIAQRIADGDTETVDVVRGKFPWLKTKVIKPWFYRYKVNLKHFHATDACIGCGRCVRSCPYASISMEDGKPVWGKLCKQCTLCSRCYQVCPQHAVAYGRATKGKGQYLCKGYIIN